MVGLHSSALVRFVALEYEPLMHGSGALAPRGQYEPGAQALHASWPGSSWNVPASHASHMPMLAIGATVPGLQGVCTVLPVDAKWPTSVGVQLAASLSDVALEYVPSLHGSAAAAPSAQYEPALHGSQDVCPSLSWNVPAAHLSHAPMLVLGATVPGLQGVWEVLPDAA